MKATWGELFERIGEGTSEVSVDFDDPVVARILDAALHEAAAVGIRRVTMDVVAKQAGVGRMTTYRRFAKRDDLMLALISRETTRFLLAVLEASETADSIEEMVVETFTAAVTFSAHHPLLSRVGAIDPGGFIGLVAAQDARILRMGVRFIASQIHRGQDGPPHEQERWVADVCARLFASYVAIPSTAPNLADPEEARRFARAILVPLAKAAFDRP